MAQLHKPAFNPKSPEWTLKTHFGRKPICGWDGPVRQDWHAITEVFHGRPAPTPTFVLVTAPMSGKSHILADTTAAATRDAILKRARDPKPGDEFTAGGNRSVITSVADGVVAYDVFIGSDGLAGKSHQTIEMWWKNIEGALRNGTTARFVDATTVVADPPAKITREEWIARTAQIWADKFGYGEPNEGIKVLAATMAESYYDDPEDYYSPIQAVDEEISCC